MAKTTSSKKEQLTEEIKQAIDRGDFVVAQELLNQMGPAASAVMPKRKRGRPPKAKLNDIISPTNTVQTQQKKEVSSSRNPENCIAPARNPQQRQPGQKIEKNGKTYTLSRKVEFEPPEGKNKFKDSGRLVAHEKLNYPDPSPRRDPAKQIEYVCDRCNRKVLLYPNQGPAEDMLYYCDKCLSRRK
jgi:DNA-directed RNA polymerase subunit RPC12/RpoP